MVEVQSLRKSFRQQRGWRHIVGRPRRKLVLSGVDLTVQRGEIFGLLGPNGAGKTTLVKILCGLVLPDSGRAIVGGQDVARNSVEVRRRIGVVYADERSFYWRLSVRENLRFYASLYGIRPTVAEVRIDELLRLMDLDDAADIRMHHFSSGMKQRAAIARGLLHDPDVIFMDEPTKSLDPVGAEDLHRLIRERVANGRRTVIIATHLMHEAEALCHRLTLIDHGITVLSGTVDDFRAWVNSEVIYRLVIAGGDLLRDSLAAIPGVVGVELQVSDPGRRQVTLRMSPSASALPLAIRYLVGHAVEILSCTREQPSLEEIFRLVVRERRARTTEEAVGQ